MSLHAKAIAAVPAQTARIAMAAFPKGNPYLQMRNEFGTFFEDEQFADLFPTRGQEARLFETLLTRFRERGLVKARGRRRTDSTHVLAATRALNRF